MLRATARPLCVNDSETRTSPLPPGPRAPERLPLPREGEWRGQRDEAIDYGEHPPGRPAGLGQRVATRPQGSEQARRAPEGSAPGALPPARRGGQRDRQRRALNSSTDNRVCLSKWDSVDRLIGR